MIVDEVLVIKNAAKVSKKDKKWCFLLIFEQKTAFSA